MGRTDDFIIYQSNLQTVVVDPSTGLKCWDVIFGHPSGYYWASQFINTNTVKLVNQIGSTTRQLEATSTSAATIQKQAERAMQDVSGVNLDEEAANLIKYQQAYQAAAKVLQLAKQMFDSLLSMSQ